MDIIFRVTCILCYFSYYGEGSTTYLTSNSSRQYITSPNYPQSYGNLQSMNWVISADSSTYNPAVYIQVVDSELQPSLACYNDVVAIYDGDSTFYPEIVSWCGSNYPLSTTHSHYNTIMISFRSDKSDNSYRGFRIAYWTQTTAKVTYVTKPLTSRNYALLGFAGTIISVILIGLGFIIYARNRDKISSLFAGEDA
ncbi:CUB domain-containing protein 2-like [Ostrea edulis]|uniref:CUB domain-containing protein 2-like n=1 Tax=Ostrea edulis TaxID=37623 RepID=UPI0020960148|nr:CUB domain-containing protein 2-like [Ostrea edulis]